MTTRLYLVRHGATTLSAENRFAGATDVDLSEEGKDQVRHLAERLGSEKISAVYASPMRRAVDTARILGTLHRLEPVTETGLREIDHGHWEGLTRAEVEARFGDEYATWEQDPYTFAPQGGESGLTVLSRALPVIRTLVLRHPEGSAVVVSHKATLRLILCSVLGLDPRGYRDRLDQSPACLNVVDFKDVVRARLLLFNDVSHYAKAHRRSGEHLSKWWDAESHR
jgi:probable phosphoglycerate mutase